MRYQPRQKQIVMCDFRNFAAPEMTKLRPVVVIKKDKSNSKLVTVVPISTSIPNDKDEYYLEIEAPLKTKGVSRSYIKCNFIYTVSIERLDTIKKGRVKYDQITEEQYLEIKEKIAKNLSL